MAFGFARLFQLDPVQTTVLLAFSALPTASTAWCHASQAQRAHQPLCPFAVDGVAAPSQIHHHLAAAVKRVTGVLLVDESLERLIVLNDRFWLLPRINRGTRYASQDALAAQYRVNADGSKQQFRVSGEPMFNQSCRFLGYRGIGVGITVKK